MLRKSGFLYKWTWIPSKDDHGQFEKGIAVFCRDSFSGAEQFFFEQEEQIKEIVYE
jgi:hypothetical protein